MINLSGILFALKAHAPAILTIGGTVTMLGGAVIGVKQTLTVDEILNEYSDNVKKIEDAHNGLLDTSRPYTEEEYKKDKWIQRRKTGWGLIKHYALPAGMLIVGTGMVLKGHGMNTNRIIGLGAALTAKEASEKHLVDGVISEFGKEAYDKIRNGLIEVTDVEDVVDEETGEYTTKKETSIVPGSSAIDDCDIWFSENTCETFRPGQLLVNVNFLKRVQSDQTSRLTLRKDGIVSELDVARAIGYVPMTKEEKQKMIVRGWNRNDPESDHFIDLGIIDRSTGEPFPWINNRADGYPLRFNSTYLYKKAGK